VAGVLCAAGAGRARGAARGGRRRPGGAGGAGTRLHFTGGSPETPSAVSARAHFDSLLRYTI